ncbi:hypothetical protein, partial [Microbispora siamensis]|uniref:hypothetical protein n=1 Tax=Microbispora siamensis TaxID=564413 RepID=UPI0019528464
MDLFDRDPDRPRRSNNADGGWWDQLTADSPLWSSEGSLAHEHFPILGDAAGSTDHSIGSGTDSVLTGGEDTG